MPKAKEAALCKTSTDFSKLSIDINATLSNVNELFMKIETNGKESN